MFRRRNAFPILIFAIAGFPLIFSCQTQTIWDIPFQEVKANLRTSNYTFLQSMDFEKKSLKDALRLGAEAPFYLYFILKDLNQEQAALNMLELLISGRDPFWESEGLVLLLAELIEKKQYDTVEELSLAYLKKQTSSRQTARIKELYFESLFLQGKDELLSKQTDSLLNYGEMASLPRVWFFRAAASFRLQSSDWTTQFEDLCLRFKVSEIHVTAYRFFSDEPSKIPLLSPFTQRLLEGKYQFAVGNPEKGIELLEETLVQLPAERLWSSPIIKELGFGYLNIGSYLKGATYLEGVSRKLYQSARLDAIEMAGRLYRKAGKTESAIALLRKVADKTDIPLQRDRCLWFILEMSLSQTLTQGLKEIERSISQWSDPFYFDDLLDRTITDLVSRGDDRYLVELYRKLGQKGSLAVQYRLAFLLRRKNIEQPDMPSGITSPYSVDTTNSLVKILYYAFLLSYQENNRVPSFMKIESDAEEPQRKERAPLAQGPLDNFALGFLDFGLYPRGYNALKENQESLQTSSLIEGARALRQNGFYSEAMRIMNLYLLRKGGLLHPDEWRLTYPLAYRDSIEELAYREKVSQYLIYAVVREESYFDPQIGSKAGAMGLMQLMPETADEVARQLRMDDFDLTDPADNLRLGSNYLGKLARRFTSIPKTLIAYNAGPTRMRKWDRLYSKLPMDLLIESIPLDETKHYVRKILVSMIMYSILYDEAQPEEIIRSFYPDL